MELLLLLSVHKGSLSSLLKWVKRGLLVCKEQPSALISKRTVEVALNHMQAPSKKNDDNPGHMNRYRLACVVREGEDTVELFEAIKCITAEVSEP